MPAVKNAADVLDRHFLEMRCGILDLAATLDRIERSPESAAVATDDRMKLIQQGLQILVSGEPDRAERIQLLFSDAYQSGWNR